MAVVVSCVTQQQVAQTYFNLLDYKDCPALEMAMVGQTEGRTDGNDWLPSCAAMAVAVAKWLIYSILFFEWRDNGQSSLTDEDYTSKTRRIDEQTDGCWTTPRHRL